MRLCLYVTIALLAGCSLMNRFDYRFEADGADASVPRTVRDGGAGEDLSEVDASPAAAADGSADAQGAEVDATVPDSSAAADGAVSPPPGGGDGGATAPSLLGAWIVDRVVHRASCAPAPDYFAARWEVTGSAAALRAELGAVPSTVTVVEGHQDGAQVALRGSYATHLEVVIDLELAPDGQSFTGAEFATLHGEGCTIERLVEGMRP